MEWEKVLAELNNGYELEIGYYKKFLPSLLKTKEEFQKNNLPKVLELQEEQREIIEAIEKVEKVLRPFKEEWQKYKGEAEDSNEKILVSSKISQVKDLLNQLFKIEEETITELNATKLSKIEQLKQHRQKKNGHSAYRNHKLMDAIFWDKRS